METLSIRKLTIAALLLLYSCNAQQGGKKKKGKKSSKGSAISSVSAPGVSAITSTPKSTEIFPITLTNAQNPIISENKKYINYKHTINTTKMTYIGKCDKDLTLEFFSRSPVFPLDKNCRDGIFSFYLEGLQSGSSLPVTIKGTYSDKRIIFLQVLTTHNSTPPNIEVLSPKPLVNGDIVIPPSGMSAIKFYCSNDVSRIETPGITPSGIAKIITTNLNCHKNEAHVVLNVPPVVDGETIPVNFYNNIGNKKSVNLKIKLGSTFTLGFSNPTSTNSRTYSSQINLTGVCVTGSTLRYIKNDVVIPNVTCTNNTFTIANQTLKLRQNVIELQATSSSGEVVSRRVYIDYIPPAPTGFKITSHPTMLSPNSGFKIEGKCTPSISQISLSPANSLNFTDNDCKDGTWSVSTNVFPSAQGTYTFSATSIYNDVIPSIDLTIPFDNSGPIINSNGSAISSSTTIISPKSSWRKLYQCNDLIGSFPLRLQVNPQSALKSYSLSGAGFCNIELGLESLLTTSPKNISIKIIDAVENSTNYSVNVIHRPLDVALNLTSPQPGSTSSVSLGQQSYTLSGNCKNIARMELRNNLSAITNINYTSSCSCSANSLCSWTAPISLNTQTGKNFISLKGWDVAGNPFKSGSTYTAQLFVPTQISSLSLPSPPQFDYLGQTVSFFRQKIDSFSASMTVEGGDREYIHLALEDPNSLKIGPVNNIFSFKQFSLEGKGQNKKLEFFSSLVRKNLQVNNVLTFQVTPRKGTIGTNIYHNPQTLQIPYQGDLIEEPQSIWHHNPTSWSRMNPKTHVNLGDTHKTFRGQGIHVGVIDQMVFLTHPDFQPYGYGKNQSDIITHGTTSSHNSFNVPYRSSKNSYLHSDGINNFHHGTFVAGLIGARIWNNTGRIGIAPDSIIHSIEEFPQSGNTNFSGVSAYSAKSDVIDVFNRSGGRSIASGPQDTFRSNNFNIYKQYQTNAHFGRSGKGISHVMAGGNYRTSQWDCTTDVEQNFPYVITVAATSVQNQCASYSTPGRCLWISAPGGPLETLKPCDDNEDNHCIEKVLDQANNFNYSVIGTSFSAPLVTGAIALLLEQNPKLSWREIKYILAKSANLSSLTLDAITPLMEDGSAAPVANNSYSHENACPIGGKVNTSGNVLVPRKVGQFPIYAPPSGGYTSYQHKFSNKAGFYYSNDFGFGLLDIKKAIEIAGYRNATNPDDPWGGAIPQTCISSFQRNTNSSVPASLFISQDQFFGSSILESQISIGNNITQKVSEYFFPNNILDNTSSTLSSNGSQRQYVMNISMERPPQDSNGGNDIIIEGVELFLKLNFGSTTPTSRKNRIKVLLESPTGTQDILFDSSLYEIYQNAVMGDIYLTSNMFYQENTHDSTKPWIVTVIEKKFTDSTTYPDVVIPTADGSGTAQFTDPPPFLLSTARLKIIGRHSCYQNDVTYDNSTTPNRCNSIPLAPLPSNANIKDFSTIIEKQFAYKHYFGTNREGKLFYDKLTNATYATLVKPNGMCKNFNKGGPDHSPSYIGCRAYCKLHAGMPHPVPDVISNATYEYCFPCYHNQSVTRDWDFYHRHATATPYFYCHGATPAYLKVSLAVPWPTSVQTTIGGIDYETNQTVNLNTTECGAFDRFSE